MILWGIRLWGWFAAFAAVVWAVSVLVCVVVTVTLTVSDHDPLSTWFYYHGRQHPYLHAAFWALAYVGAAVASAYFIRHLYWGWPEGPPVRR